MRSVTGFDQFERETTVRSTMLCEVAPKKVAQWLTFFSKHCEKGHDGTFKINLDQIKRSRHLITDWTRSRGYAARDEMRANGWSSLSEQIIFKKRGAYQRAWVIGSLIMRTLRIFDHISNALELPAVPILQTTTHSLGITYVKSRPFMFPEVFNPEYFM